MGGETLPVIGWLMDGDPAIRWQTMRDLLDAPEQSWRAERARVETEGWGARLLAAQDEDGQWAGGAFLPAGFDPREWHTHGQPWTATSFSLTQLREFGLDPQCPRARASVALIAQNSRWDEAGQPFWEGETEACINGRTVADGAYFGVDVAPIVDRLLSQRQNDGGWNCARCSGSRVSSFASTINVLEGLLGVEQAGGANAAVRAARLAGEDYLLRRHLFRRLSTGQPADERFLTLTYPLRWRYDILRALDYFRSAARLAGAPPDPRLAQAIAILRARRDGDNRWRLDWEMPGRRWLDFGGGVGDPSPWITLKALRVLRWWDAHTVRQD